jgi:hypothetical protein
MSNASFDHLCWFIAAAGEYRKKYTTNEEWLSVVKGAGLVEIMEHINSIGTPVEKPPPKKTLSDDELLED